LNPSEEYTSRLERFRAAEASSGIRFRQLGNARLATAISAAVIAWMSFGAGWITAWWLLAPLAIFIALAIAHEGVDRAKASAARGRAYFERAAARLEGRWIGAGNQGERFRNPRHVYSDDLDLFGRGSLFELLCNARTAAGESALARWLLDPASREEVECRQRAVEELSPRVDLREELAVMGEDIRAAVDARPVADWGSRPEVRFFPGARIAAAVLSAAAVLAAVLFFGHVTDARPLFAIFALEIAFNLAVRDGVRQVLAGVTTPARELRLLALLLARVEREPFDSPSLVDLKKRLETDGVTASRQIRRLERYVEHMTSARMNQFLRLPAAGILWIPQFAMAIEAWRRRCGPHIGEWTAAIGDFEALCSLAGFAYERPNASFPELLSTAEPLLEASTMHHPLITARESVPNDVSIGGATRLWIVSGSNMSGKSTLLRSIGLNVVLAWAGAPVTAAKLNVSALRVGASTRTIDSLADHRSRFYAEIERLRDIVELARGGQPTLFLFDELLSGTNSHDRRIGAEALLRGLVARGAIGLVTTHDLALARIAETLPGAVNVHFEDHLEGGEIKFDYRLRSGVVTRSNALELMRAVGLEV
jgi:hypothetical protein